MAVIVKSEDPILLLDPKTELLEDEFDEEADNNVVPSEFIELPDTIEVNGAEAEKEDIILGRYLLT